MQSSKIIMRRPLEYKQHTIVLQNKEKWRKIVNISREGGDNGLFIKLVPKVYNSIILFVGLTIWRYYWILMGSLIKSSVRTFQPLIVISRIGNLCIIIGNVYQFIAHNSSLRNRSIGDIKILLLTWKVKYSIHDHFKKTSNSLQDW